MRSAAMKLLVPYQIDDTKLVSSNIVETDYPVWSPNGDYSSGTRVIRTAGVHKVFERLVSAAVTEGSSANLIPNSSFSAAVAGVLGSGGTMPTNVVWNSGAGVTREILGTGVTAEGLPYIDLRISGTNSGGSTIYPDVYLLPSTYVRAQVGEVFTLSASVFTLAGSRAGFSVANSNFNIGEYSLTGTYLRASGMATSGTTRTSVTHTVASAQVGYVSCFISLAVQAGSSVDLTFRVVAPQLERGSVATTFVPTAPGGVGLPPESDPIGWYPVGPTNRWAMFDDSVGTHSIATGTIQVSLQGLGAINDIVLLGVTGTSVTVTLPDTSRTVPVPAPQGSEGSVVLIEGLSSLGGTLQVTVSGSGTVMVGNISIGTFSTVADSVWGTTLGIADFSTKEFDDYGEVIIVERDYASTVNAKLEFPTMDADRIVRLLAAVRSTPVVWVGVPGFISSVVFGYYKDFSLTLSSGHKSTGTVQVEALAFGGN